MNENIDPFRSIEVDRQALDAAVERLAIVLAQLTEDAGTVASSASKFARAPEQRVVMMLHLAIERLSQADALLAQARDSI